MNTENSDSNHLMLWVTIAITWTSVIAVLVSRLRYTQSWNYRTDFTLM